MISLLFSLNCLILETNKRLTINVGDYYISDDKIKIPFKKFTISNFKEQLFRKQIIKNVIQVPDNMDLLIVLENVKDKTKDEITKLGTMMDPEFLLAKYFNESDKKPEKDRIHIVIIVPTGGSEHSDENPQQAGKKMFCIKFLPFMINNCNKLFDIITI
jgi:hypothetical protein